jgi:hypothetical protein
MAEIGKVSGNHGIETESVVEVSPEGAKAAMGVPFGFEGFVRTRNGRLESARHDLDPYELRNCALSAHKWNDLKAPAILPAQQHSARVFAGLVGRDTDRNRPFKACISADTGNNPNTLRTSSDAVHKFVCRPHREG